MKSIPFNPRRIHLFLRFSLGVRVTEHPRDGGALERYGGVGAPGPYTAAVTPGRDVSSTALQVSG